MSQEKLLMYANSHMEEANVIVLDQGIQSQMSQPVL